jgi:hypothetical protein
MKSPRTYLLKRSSGLKQKNDYLQNQSMECYDAPLFNKIPGHLNLYFTIQIIFISMPPLLSFL